MSDSKEYIPHEFSMLGPKGMARIRAEANRRGLTLIQLSDLLPRLKPDFIVKTLGDAVFERSGSHLKAVWQAEIDGKDFQTLSKK